MKSFLDAVKGASSALAAIAGAALCFLMLLTIADVVLRILGRPIVGTYELVGLGGAIAIGLSLPLTSWVRGHIYVDSFVARLPRLPRAILNIATRLLVLALFFLIGWNLLKYAMDLRARRGSDPHAARALLSRHPRRGGRLPGGVPGHGRRHREDLERQV